MKTNLSPDYIVAMNETFIWCDMAGNVRLITLGQNLSDQLEMKSSKLAYA